MKRLEIVGLAVALFLVFYQDLFILVGGGPQFGNPLGDMGSADRIKILFWSVVVFVYFLLRFREWADPPQEFAQTPPRNCTTRGSYLIAGAAYAGLLLAVFWLLIIVPQLIDLVRQAVMLIEQADSVTAAFPDAELEDKGRLTPPVDFWSGLSPARAAPYATLLLLIYPRYKMLGERQLRRFFQDRALIPKTARDIIEEIGDGRDRKKFKPARSVLQDLDNGVLRGSIDTSRYPDHQHMHDIILAEYLYHCVKRESGTASRRARQMSDFEEIKTSLKGTRSALHELIREGRELIKLLEADEVRAVEGWISHIAELTQCLRRYADDLVTAAANPDAQAAGDRSVLFDPERKELVDLRLLLVDGSNHLVQLRPLMVIDGKTSLTVESMRSRLCALVRQMQNLLEQLQRRQEDKNSKFAVNQSGLLIELKALLTSGESLVQKIETAVADAAEERPTLDWIESYRETLTGTKHRLFKFLFDARYRECLLSYRALRAQLTRLMTTLVLASDPSAEARANHFEGFGFKLLPKGDRRIPHHPLWLTFSFVFVLCFATSLAYWVLYSNFVETARDFFGVSLESLFGVVKGSGWTANLRIQDPIRAVVWAFIAAMMQMMAVWLSLAAWKLSPDYQESPVDGAESATTMLNAVFTGLIFGFVGAVLAFFLLGLVLGNPSMLRQAWAWTLIGGITGGFLLLQGILVRRQAVRARYIAVVAQGVCSALAAWLIAWVWGYGHVRADALAAFALYSGANLLLVGTVLGMLARYFMSVDHGSRATVTYPQGSGAPAPRT